MSVTIRPYRRGGWEVDVRVVAPDGTRQSRERKRAPVLARSAAVRWAEGCERMLFERLMQPQDHTSPKEVPTLREFASRFIDGHARANRQKPSGIATKERVLRVHLVPALGHRKLDAIKSEDVQRLKCALQAKAPKTVNNVLAVLSVLLKKAIEWEVIERMPCTVKLLPVPKGSAAFYDFDQPLATRAPDSTPGRGAQCAAAPAERARALSGRRHTAHAAVRAGEDEAGVTPGGDDARWVAHSAALVLFAPGDARSPGPGDSGARGPCGSDDDPALHASHAGGPRRGDPAARGTERRDDPARIRTKFWRHFGDEEGLRRKDQWIEQLNWR
jgi:hypothetical protein